MTHTFYRSLIKRLISVDKPKTAVKETAVVSAGNPGTAPLLERTFLFLEDGKWQDANIYCEKVLDINPKNAEAYVGKLMALLQVKKRRQLADCAEPFDDRDNFAKVLRFGDEGLVSELKGYIDQINERNKLAGLNKIYDNAQGIMRKAQSAGEFEKAAEAFERIADFQDAKALSEKCRKQAEECRKKNVNIGDTVNFGTYPQNENGKDKTPVSWKILAKKGNNLLVISEKALDCRSYNTSYTNVTWASCTLRSWLNDTFLNAAFSVEEQAMIQSTAVSADKNPAYRTRLGNATTDKVFLLSITETEKYFSSDEDRKCVPTAYAIAQGAYTRSSYEKGGATTCWWWLRSPGIHQDYAACVDHDGSVSFDGNNVNADNDAVRPALWINLGSEIFES